MWCSIRATTRPDSSTRTGATSRRRSTCRSRSTATAERARATSPRAELRRRVTGIVRGRVVARRRILRNTARCLSGVVALLEPVHGVIELTAHALRVVVIGPGGAGLARPLAVGDDLRVIRVVTAFLGHDALLLDQAPVSAWGTCTGFDSLEPR